MRYLIYGTGAVGGLLGGKLSLAGHEVIFLARERIASAMQQSGLRLGPDPHSQLPSPRVTVSLPTALELGHPDLVLLTVKAYDVEAAGAELAVHLDRQIPVVSFLNGIGNEARLAGYLGEARIIPATLTTAVQMLDPGVLRIEKERGIGFAGTHDRLDQLSAEFESAGFIIRRYADPARMKWSKLMTNIVANASSAILGWSAGQVFSHPGIARLEIEALRETLRVMKALGHAPVDLPGVRVSLLGHGMSLPAPIIQRVLRQVVSRGRGKKMPSLYHDIGRHRSEVYWLNGAVVQADPTNNTPANRVLLETMDKLVEDASAAARYQDYPDELLRLAAQYGVPGIPLWRE